VSTTALDVAAAPEAQDALNDRMRQLAAAVARSQREPGELLTEGLHLVRGALESQDEGLPGARRVRRSLSVLRAATRSRRAATIASTDEFAARADRMQLAVQDGPVLQALATDRAVQGDCHGNAVLATPLGAVGHHGMVLTVYRGGAAPLPPLELATVDLATVAIGMLLSVLAQRNRADNLDIALQSSRRIGAAIGVLMSGRHWTYDEAFAALRDASQRDQRRLRDIADEVLLTGTLVE
jgi:hypothetical protein